MIKQLAYWIVFRDLQKNSMFNGIYDARSGDPNFMYGISIVMEKIAYSAFDFDDLETIARLLQAYVNIQRQYIYGEDGA